MAFLIPAYDSESTRREMGCVFGGLVFVEKTE